MGRSQLPFACLSLMSITANAFSRHVLQVATSTLMATGSAPSRRKRFCMRFVDPIPGPLWNSIDMARQRADAFWCWQILLLPVLPYLHVAKILKLHSSNDLSSYMRTGNIKKATEDNPSKNHNQINKPNQTFNNQIQEPNIDPKNGTIQSAILRHRNITTCHLSNVTIKFTREERAETVDGQKNQTLSDC